MNSKYIFSIFLAITLFFSLDNALSQTDSTKAENFEPKLSLSYLKNTKGIRLLTGELKVKYKKQQTPIENAEIIFYAGDEPKVKLGTAKSDKKGKAIFEIKPETEIPLNDTGAVKYSVEYKGEQNSESAKDEIFIMDISIDMTLAVIDSARTVTIKATKMGKNKEKVPLGGQEINIYVKRLYSDLKIGTVSLSAESGEGSLQFPVIPGDSIGDVNVIARIDGEIYGTVEKRELIKWGTPVEYQHNRIGPALWSSSAPTWMTVTLYIFLAGVWYHLILIFMRLYKVKKLGQTKEKKID